MVFFWLQTSYSNLPKQVDILSPSIKIIFQNIENQWIREHWSKNCKFLPNFLIMATFMDIETTKKFCRLILLKENFKSAKNVFGLSIVKKKLKFPLNLSLIFTNSRTRNFFSVGFWKFLVWFTWFMDDP